MRAIVVGRHELTGDEGIEVVAQENINFPATSEECFKTLKHLEKIAMTMRCCIIFQMMPGQLASAIYKFNTNIPMGVIINKPGKRESGIINRFLEEDTDSLDDQTSPMIQAVKAANPRVKIEIKPRTDGGFGRIVEFTVDPPLRFEFSHIEWF